MYLCVYNRWIGPDVSAALFTCETGCCVTVGALIIAWFYNTKLVTSLPHIGTFPSIDPDVQVR